MFAVGNILISDDLLEARFACNVTACQGACCVVGDSGAPLEPEEREAVEAALPAVRHRLRQEALKVIERKGVWEETAPGRYATTCVGSAECVFVTYAGPVATCSIQAAWQEGRVDFPKPISCHLYPVRVEDLGDYEALNWERVPICEAGEKHGLRRNVRLEDFLEDPLVRRYGREWYDEFKGAIEARRTVLAEAS